MYVWILFKMGIFQPAMLVYQIWTYPPPRMPVANAGLGRASESHRIVGLHPGWGLDPMSDFLTIKDVITTSQETVRDAHPLLSALLDCLKMQTLLSSKWPDLCHTLIFIYFL